MFQCLVSSCQSSKHKAHGLCEYHYGLKLKGKPLDTKKRRYSPGSVCIINGCDDASRSNGMCNKHNARMKKYGDPHFVKSSRDYGSGKDWHLNPLGYVVRYEPSNPNSGPNGQVYQHRHVMSEMIGRPLRANENVHHVNGKRDDNRLENLELWSKGQPAGQRVTDIVKWAINVLTDFEMVDAAIKLDPSIEAQVKPLRQAPACR